MPLKHIPCEHKDCEENYEVRITFKDEEEHYCLIHYREYLRVPEDQVNDYLLREHRE